MNEGKATIASVMCPVSLKLQFCYSHFTECPASNWWGSISSSLYVTPSWESVGREKCNSGKEKRKESCVLLYRWVPVPSYLKMMEQATVRIRNVPSGKLPPLLMWSVTCLQPTTLDANLPAAIPLDLLQSLPLSSGMDGHSHVIIFRHRSCLIPELAERPFCMQAPRASLSVWVMITPYSALGFSSLWI